MMFPKRSVLLLVVLLLIVPMALVACGDDDDDGGNGDVSLDTEYTTDSGLSLKYPDGWDFQDNEGMIMIANREGTFESDEMEKGDFGLTLFAPDIAGMLMGDAATPADAANAMAVSIEDDDMTVGEVEDVTVGDHSAARINISSENGEEGFILAVDLGDGQFALMVAAGGEDGFDEYEDTALEIAGSMSYAAPADDAGDDMGDADDAGDDMGDADDAGDDMGDADDAGDDS